MKSIFDKETYTEVLSRIDALKDSSKGNWGKMEVGQMLHHCQFPLKIALNRYNFTKKPNPVMKLLFKSFKKNMYNDKPWKRNLPTAKGLKVTSPKEFNTEKKRLITLINDFYAEREKESRSPHPMFGHFTKEQWGQMQYKHLDHHLRQFDA
ncbi:DUF1569 domain-containing protein [Muricauda sp. JGD-17]|uniref:DUF1569 domain-containing protein n=1 Tax=Flagellimonas ochracea TaxID=2696472 RepID=A0A964WY67_9FLAO|nr:DUF1569 domain-containing protein [Allomuricauda ochracea]NAY92906.1 DUF1569 domain-containing protein [Allomuricauda ochracea]